MKLSLTTSLTAVAALALFYIAPVPTACQGVPSSSAQKDSKDATAAQPVRRLADGHPDLNGFWASSSGPDTPVGASFGPAGGGGGGRRNDGELAKARLADPNQPPYKPELMQKVKDLAREESKTDPAFYCKPGGVPRIGPPHAIIQVPGMPIVFLYQVIAGNTFRLVPMDGRPHNTEVELTYYGDSIGRWDGDTLVVDSNGFNDDTWLGIDGWFHSEALHVVERISREADSIRYQATVEDPNVFTRPWTMNTRIAKSTTELIIENAPCIERDESHVVDFGLKTTPSK